MFDRQLEAQYSAFSKKRAKLRKADRYDRLAWQAEQDALNRNALRLTEQGKMDEDNTFFLSRWQKLLDILALPPEL